MLAGSLAQADRNSVCFAFQQVIPRHGIPACQNPVPGMLAPAKRQSHRFSCSREHRPPVCFAFQQVIPRHGIPACQNSVPGMLAPAKRQSDSVAQEHRPPFRAFFKPPPDYGSRLQNAMHDRRDWSPQVRGHDVSKLRTRDACPCEKANLWIQLPKIMTLICSERSSGCLRISEAVRKTRLMRCPCPGEPRSRGAKIHITPASSAHCWAVDSPVPASPCRTA